MGKLRDELKQRKPFRNLREEAMLNIWRTGDLLAERLESLLKTYGLSQSQYNVLRILRGAGEEGMPCGEVAARMLTRGPDLTRMLDRLTRGRLARRVRVRHDRRIILARITPKGLNLLEKLENPVARLTDGMMAHMRRLQLKTIIEVLEELRAGLATYTVSTVPKRAGSRPTRSSAHPS